MGLTNVIKPYVSLQLRDRWLKKKNTKRQQEKIERILSKLYCDRLFTV